MDISKWLELPIYLQATLGGGYLAYAIAYNGKRDKERTSDVLLGSVLMSLPCLIVWLGLDAWQLPVWAIVLEVVAVALLIGILWRKWGMSAWYRLMHSARVSNSDDRSDVWHTITQAMDIAPTQLMVVLNSGTEYFCDDTQKFIDAPVSQYLTDKAGSVAMYVTHWRSADGDFVATESVQHGSGCLLTYIPASQIKLVEFRHVKIT